MIRKNSFYFFPPFVFTIFTFIVDIIILNPIGSYKLNFNGTIFVLRPILTSKLPNVYSSKALSFFTMSLTLGALGSSSCMFIGVNLELSSLVLWNKSHPSFLVGDCTRSFQQVKYTNCMVRNIS